MLAGSGFAASGASARAVTVRGTFNCPWGPTNPGMAVTWPVEAAFVVVVVVALPPELPVLLAAAALVLGVRSKMVIVVVDEGEAIELIDALRIGVGRLMSPLALVNDELPPNGAKMSRLNGA